MRYSCHLPAAKRIRPILCLGIGRAIFEAEVFSGAYPGMSAIEFIPHLFAAFTTTCPRWTTTICAGKTDKS